ncbi:2-dehydro-3-deoxygalactonokinase [Amycolatopsis palatopharyngis]|uniref:2-dehydro-3-deoxygalactonokinase n=1 Tax=Amycolatopsis palatopharyngis TaxID=187982 RepID=UPI000E228202|nr:2-dehydro-3-deoxygalactonokinase [Amycolatopsis palatopharyngis]
MSDDSGSPSLIALDWGSSTQRAWLLDDDGRILAARRPGQGLFATTAEIDPGDPRARAQAYEDAFHAVCGDWLAADPDVPVIACGMVGSAHGWAEAGYLTVPTALRFGREALVPVTHRRGVVHLVPGLRIPSADMLPGDVIRGEETQVVGALDMIGGLSGAVTVILPGTHSKWVRVGDGTVCSFETALSGELFGLLTRQGILARTAADPVRDDAAFARGLAAGSPGVSRGLSTELFGARPLVLDGALAPASVPDYISGVVIADEVGHLMSESDRRHRVVLCGTADLCRRYSSALAGYDIEPIVLTEEVAARGLWRIAVATELVSDRERTPNT